MQEQIEIQITKADEVAVGDFVNGCKIVVCEQAYVKYTLVNGEETLQMPLERTILQSLCTLGKVTRRVNKKVDLVWEERQGSLHGVVNKTVVGYISSSKNSFTVRNPLFTDIVKEKYEEITKQEQKVQNV